MSLRVEKCAGCGQAYMLEQCNPAFAPGVTPGVITCPVCGITRAADPQFAYLGHKLDDESK
ncbi:MAG TPA: hypothetical protein VIM12_14035 [Noviherbaspirillum sp.]|jgi:hypothetical protein|uniref:hypothetical protein n=1 Tax=Noviherbaspirillum sp. TaxID=1926288 RepID=UPI002F947B1C